MPINIKRSFTRILVSTFLAFWITMILAASGTGSIDQGIKTIVIDAGHGGKDSGAVGKKSQEKDLALAIALKVGHYVEENMPDVNIVYTRKTDVAVGLWKRAEIANEAEADLFISIHVNAHTRSSARGTLTLVLGQHRSSENLDVAMRENSVILLEDDYETIYEGFDPTSTESYIMFSLMQKTFFKQSIEFGDFVQHQFRERAQRRDLGVREQGILVLAQTSMPGVLIETGFISNAEEEKYLMTEYGQDIIASAIYRGFREYKEEIDRRSDFTSIVRKPENKEAEPEILPEPVTIREDQIVFSIQVASSRNKIPTDPSSFKGHKDITVVEDGRWFKYMTGMVVNYNDALSKCLVVKKDFPDAFIVALKNGKLITLKEAIIEINQ